jgi:hypothetical protein
MLAFLPVFVLLATVPKYLSDDQRRIADIPCRGRLRSAATNRFDICPAHLKINVKNLRVQS